MDTPDFRALLGCFATGVTVATTVDEKGAPAGMTASAVSAVSLDPPLLLVCVGKDTTFHKALAGNVGFALSVLADDQQDLSLRFAQTEFDPFDGVPTSRGPRGLVLLDGAVAHIICGPWSSYEAGDHTVFFGEVQGGEIYDRTPLLHFRSRYTSTLR